MAMYSICRLPPSAGSQGRGYPDLTLVRDGIVMWFELKQEAGETHCGAGIRGSILPKGTWYVIRPADIGWVEAVLRMVRAKRV